MCIVSVTPEADSYSARGPVPGRVRYNLVPAEKRGGPVLIELESGEGIIHTNQPKNVG